MAKYTQEQLEAAFKLVQNKKHWKNPINATIENPGEEQVACIEEAVIHFTGSIPDVVTLKGGKIRVQAEGYYAMEAGMGMF
jgi:hypothetical protein